MPNDDANDPDEQAARIRRQAILLTVAVVVVIAVIALAVMVPAAIRSWRAYDG